MDCTEDIKPQPVRDLGAPPPYSETAQQPHQNNNSKIKFTLIDNLHGGREVAMTVNRNQAISVMIQTYFKKTGIRRDETSPSFRYDGEPLPQEGTQTYLDLEIEDGAVLYLNVRQDGGGKNEDTKPPVPAGDSAGRQCQEIMHAPSEYSEAAQPPQPTKTGHIKLTLLDMIHGRKVTVIVNPDRPVSVLIQNYLKKSGIRLETNPRFSYDGERLPSSGTTSYVELGIEDGAEIYLNACLCGC